MRCGILGKSRTEWALRVPERFFGKIPGKIFAEIVLGKFGEVDHHWR